MHCPDCGCEIDLNTEFCPDCGSNFSEMSEIEKKIAFNRPLPSVKTKSKIKYDSSNANGYVVAEGSSIKGGKLKKGASTSRGGSRVTGHDSNNAVRRDVHKIKSFIKDDEEKPQRPIKMDYETKKSIGKDVLGGSYLDEDDY